MSENDINTHKNPDSLSIWTSAQDGGDLKPENAIEVMTDNWIQSGNYCDQTIMDMRDVIRSLLEANKNHDA